MADTYRKLQVFNKSYNFREAIKLIECYLQKPEPGQVRIRNIYAGINATDVNITAARYLVTDKSVPYDLGFEAMGLIDAIGSEIPEGQFEVGQPVMVLMGADADGFSEYLYKPPESLIPIPELDPKYLSALVNGLSAAIALDKSVQLKQDDKILVTAAAGGTGLMAVQLAKAKGCYVIGTTSSEEKEKLLKEFGVDLVINYKEKDFDQELSEHFPNGIDCIWETVGGETFKQLFNHLSLKGRMIIIGSTPDYTEEIGFQNAQIDHLNWQLITGSKSLTGFIIFNYVSDFPDYLPKLIEMIQSGEIKTRIDLGEGSEEGKFVGLEQVARAEEWLHAGKNVGKVAVKIQEP